METELLYLRDAHLRSFEATVAAVDPEGGRVALDRTAFYPTGGGQPHDTGTMDLPAGTRIVTAVRKEGDLVWHQLMRTHTALHILCGVIWNEWGVPVTGGNMEPLSARMDFEFDPLPDGFKERVEELVDVELAADRPIEVSFLPRTVAVQDEDLIRTNVGLRKLTDDQDVRVVEIVGFDKQADGGTHVASTGEVGRIKIVKTESKGKGNKRVRLQVLDAPGDV